MSPLNILSIAFLLNILAFAVLAEGDPQQRYRFGPAEIILETLEPRPEGISFIFVNAANEWVQPEITINGELTDGVLRLPDSPQGGEYRFTAAIRRAGAPADTIVISYYPKVLYATSGQVDARSDRHPLFYRTHLETPVSLRLFARGSRSAQKTWTSTGGSDKSRSEENLEEILTEVMAALRGRTGVPSDVLGSVSVREQYVRAVRGADQVWCDELARILQFALTSIGIQPRMIATGSECQKVGELCLLAVECHTTVEYFSREQNGCVWVHPTVGVLGASVNGRTLDLTQFIQVLDTPLQSDVKICYLDAATRQTRVGDVTDEQLKNLVDVYFRPGVRLYF